MTRPAKDRTHGRRAHKASGGCDTGRTPYPNKAAAEKAGSGQAERCGRCKKWHDVADHPRRRR